MVEAQTEDPPVVEGAEDPPAPSVKEEAAAAMDAYMSEQGISTDPPPIPPLEDDGTPDPAPAKDAPAGSHLSRRQLAAAKHLGMSDDEIAKTTPEEARGLMKASRRLREQEQKAGDKKGPDPEEGDPPPSSGEGDEPKELSEDSSFEEVIAVVKAVRKENADLHKKITDTDARVSVRDEEAEKEEAKTEREKVAAETDTWFKSHDAKSFTEFGGNVGMSDLAVDSPEWEARLDLLDEVDVRMKGYKERGVDKPRGEVLDEALRHLYPSRFTPGSSVSRTGRKKEAVARASGTKQILSEEVKTAKDEAAANMHDYMQKRGINTD